MRRCDVDLLDPTRTYWVPAVVSPSRYWRGAEACRLGSRFIVNPETCEPTRDEFDTFESELSCLEWILLHRPQLNRNLPGAKVTPVRLDHWLLGLS